MHAMVAAPAKGATVQAGILSGTEPTFDAKLVNLAAPGQVKPTEASAGRVMGMEKIALLATVSTK